MMMLMGKVKNEREQDKIIEEYLKMHPYVSRERGKNPTKEQMIAICIEELLHKMPKKEAMFVKYRYFKCWSVLKIAHEMCYSQQMVYVIRKRALKIIYHGISHLLEELEDRFVTHIC